MSNEWVPLRLEFGNNARAVRQLHTCIPVIGLIIAHNRHIVDLCILYDGAHISYGILDTITISILDISELEAGSWNTGTGTDLSLMCYVRLRRKTLHVKVKGKRYNGLVSNVVANAAAYRNLLALALAGWCPM